MKTSMKKLLILCCTMYLALAAHAQTTRVYDLSASMMGNTTMWDGTVLPIWGFRTGINPPGSIPAVFPAPLIEANEGDTLVMNVRNFSMEPHTLHPHGLDADQINDGVPHTSFFITPMGGQVTYTVTATHAGEYFYHCHFETTLHQQMGMVGIIRIHPAGATATAWTGGPAYDKAYYWFMTEFDGAWHQNPPALGQFFNYNPNYFLINGKAKQQVFADTSISIQAGLSQKIFLTLSTLGYGMNKVVFPPALQAEVIHSDGRPLPSPFITDTLEMSPGERYGVMITPLTTTIDSITVYYHSMYNQQYWGENKVPVSITSGTGIGSWQQSTPWLVYPNPTHGTITFAVPPDMKNKRCHVTLLDSKGARVADYGIMELHDNKVTLPARALAQGVFHLQLNDGSRLQSQKIIITQ